MLEGVLAALGATRSHSMRFTGIFQIAIVFVVTALASSVPRIAAADAYSILAVEEMWGRVTILAADDPQRRVSIPVGFKPHEIVVSPDGKTAYVSNFGLNDAEIRDGIPGETVSVIDIEHARVCEELRLPSGLKAPHGLGVRPQHAQELFVNAEQGDRMIVFDASRCRPASTISCSPKTVPFCSPLAPPDPCIASMRIPLQCALPETWGRRCAGSPGLMMVNG